jgi:hypothetical protein
MAEPGSASCSLDQDEDGVWCAGAKLYPGVGAHGEGETPTAAIADLRDALAALTEEFGVPDGSARWLAID